MTVPAQNIVAFLRDFEDCRVTCEAVDFEVSGLAHVEDRDPSALCWYRRSSADGFTGTLGVIVTNQKEGLPSSKVIVYHPNPRWVLQRLIEQFFVSATEEICITQGHRCRVHASSVLGANGQGYSWENDRWRSFPHCGGIRMGDDVHVGALTSIMRGSVGDTVIGADTKIGNNVNIGHDTRIGEHVLVIAGASLAGWVRVGDLAKIWQGASIKNGVHIGHGAEVAMGAVVLSDVPDGEVWAGNPARRIR